MARQDGSEQTSGAEGLTGIDVIAVALALSWVAGLGAFFWLVPPVAEPGAPFDGLRLVVMLMAIFMPVGLIGVAAVAARSARILRVESQRMQAAVDAMRRMYLADRAPKSEALLTGEQASEPAPTRFASRREVSRLITPQPAPQTQGDQPTLALDPAPQDSAPPLSRADMIRAVNFPEDENDAEGFAALRRALKDRNARKLVQASQDVLTLLSQDGIYMDDLRPDPVSADVWRRFAKGERGHAVMGLGLIRDGAALALAGARMREDTIFRDVVHHFLRCFDRMVASFEADATDTDLLAMAETRTARAFVLMARATGTFD
ncbi:hypothetical protein [Yoonia sp.]|uniref:hypothetical protein n=1 Tax=Yoonia sp. TaxID=2212373 RepID=UPI0025CFCD67|nr:hypothetical protein [Yoonia sp.]